MFQKNCSQCELPSFGSSDNEWICPHCNKDITDLPCEFAGSKSKELHMILKE